VEEDRVFGVKTAVEAVAVIVRRLPEYEARHAGFRSG
jgi:hypothetical protein